MISAAGVMCGAVHLLPWMHLPLVCARHCVVTRSSFMVSLTFLRSSICSGVGPSSAATLRFPVSFLGVDVVKLCLRMSISRMEHPSRPGRLGHTVRKQQFLVPANRVWAVSRDTLTRSPSPASMYLKSEKAVRTNCSRVTSSGWLANTDSMLSRRPVSASRGWKKPTFCALNLRKCMRTIARRRLSAAISSFRSRPLELCGTWRQHEMRFDLSRALGSVTGFFLRSCG